MDSSSTTTVKILDKEYRVSCSRDEEQGLRQASQYLNEKMRHIRASGIIGTERIAIMAALNITYEFLQNQDRNILDDNDAQEQIKQMLGKLDKALMSIDN